MSKANVCPNCYREHSGKCDTRDPAQRKLDQDKKRAEEIARKLGGGKK